MGRTKSFLDYEQDIREAHAAGDYDKLHSRVAKWAERVPLSFYAANNEQKPYDSDDLQGCEVLPMPPKKKLGFNQTGDYIGFLPDYLDAENKPHLTGVFWDRKELSDWYNTIIHGQDRFYNECQRSIEIDACDYMLIGVEGTLEKFLTYMPLQKLNGKVRKTKGASVASRAALVDHLAPRFDYRVNIQWHGGRSYAAKALVKRNRQWLKHHYADVLGLT